MTSHSQIMELKDAIKQATVNGKKNTKNAAVIKRARESIEELRTKLNQDEDLLEKLTTVLDFGYGNQFEVRILIGNYMFSSEIKRNFLREEEKILVRKYSRKTEVEFTLLGLVTQSGAEKATASLENNEDEENFKLALSNIVDGLAGVESTFSGRTNNEIMLDPIALYRDLG